jgi:hypothetical protein
MSDVAEVVGLIDLNDVCARCGASTPVFANRKIQATRPPQVKKQIRIYPVGARPPILSQSQRQAQRMRGEHLVEPGDGAGGARKGGCKRRIDGGRARRVQQRVQHFFYPVAQSFEWVFLIFGDAARQAANWYRKPLSPS